MYLRIVALVQFSFRSNIKIDRLQSSLHLLCVLPNFQLRPRCCKIKKASQKERSQNMLFFSLYTNIGNSLDKPVPTFPAQFTVRSPSLSFKPWMDLQTIILSLVVLQGCGPFFTFSAKYPFLGYCIQIHQ